MDRVGKLIGKFIAKCQANRLQLRKWGWWTVGIIVALQIYFVRELFAAEILFGMIFGALLLMGLLFFLVRELGGRILAWAGIYARELAELAKRTLPAAAQLEEVSRKPFPHPRSESVQ